MLEIYEPQPSALRTTPFEIQPFHAFSRREHDALTEALAVAASPYRDYAAYSREVDEQVMPRLPAFLRELCAAACERDLREQPVLLLRNCPRGEVPVLDFDDSLQSKYARKTDFTAETFLYVISELLGASIVTYRSANHGDMFHDIHPARHLEFTITQKTVNTLHFHSDLPNNEVRPDWVYLLSLRNSRDNEAYTPIVRNADVIRLLDPEVLKALRSPLFHAPKAKRTAIISSYGDASAGFTELHPIVFDLGDHTVIACHEGCTTSPSDEGREALRALTGVLHRIKYDLFLEEGDFAGISNNDCMHARHVVKVRDMEAHRHRWLLKTWNIDDLDRARPHFVAGRINTIDE